MGDLTQIIRGFFGILVVLAICVLLSRNRRAISYRIVVFGILLQLLVASVVFKTDTGAQVLRSLTQLFSRVLAFSYEGSSFVFGAIGEEDSKHGFSFAFQALPLVIYFAALMAVLYHLRVMQPVIYVFARLLGKILRVSGAESMVVTANVFIGMTEAPLVVRPYLDKLTRSELMALMVGGFATVAGTLFGVYLAFVGETYGPFLFAASLMSAPAAFVTAKILLPETEESTTGEHLTLDLRRSHPNLLAAIAAGTGEGLRLALNIAAMLIAFYSLIALLNWPLAAWFNTSIHEIFGYVFRPLAWCLGVDWQDAGKVGTLLGLKVSTNEFIAYTNLDEMIRAETLSPRSIKIATFALCGFANFGSIGVTLGALGQLMPERRDELSRVALLAMVGGALASFLTAAVAGIFA